MARIERAAQIGAMVLVEAKAVVTAGTMRERQAAGRAVRIDEEDVNVLPAVMDFRVEPEIAKLAQGLC